MHGFSRKIKQLPVCAAIGALVFLCPCSTLAGKVVLRIRAGNPIEEPQKVQIKANLPARVSTNDIISLGGLELGYDVKSDTYYVHREVDLGPKEIAIHDVEINDIWVVSEEELRTLVRRAGELVKLLDQVEAEEYRASAVAIQSDITRAVESIREHQGENSIPEVTPVQHIRAYETNLKVFSRVRKDVGRIENLVLASGQDPGTLIGEARDIPSRRPTRIAVEDYTTALFRITVRNTSPARSRKISVHRDLPEEIKPADVLESGGLEVGADSKRGVTYVFKKDVELAPNETVTYDVTIRDKWNVNKPRIVDLRSRIETIIGQVGEEDQYKSVDDSLKQLLSLLAKIGNEIGPENLSAEYVAFHRDQAARLDGIEQKIHRLEAALRPSEKRQKRGFRIQPPSMKTTWLIIYVVLGFLALMSLLFFLRWMGRSKAERMQEEEGEEPSQTEE